PVAPTWPVAVPLHPWAGRRADLLRAQPVDCVARRDPRLRRAVYRRGADRPLPSAGRPGDPARVRRDRERAVSARPRRHVPGAGQRPRGGDLAGAPIVGGDRGGPAVRRWAGAGGAEARLSPVRVLLFFFLVN